MQVKRAKRQKVKAAVAYIGASGSGKTLSMLLTAYGMMKEKYPDKEDPEVWEKIGVVDTEHERSTLYADMTIKGNKVGEFLHINLTAPFTAQRYEDAIQAIKKEGAEVIIIDSLSHAWENEGGFLDLQQKHGGNFQAWNKVKPEIQRFVKSLTENDVHILASMRTKQDYQVEESDTGKLKIRKMGLKPIQKDDLEYEFMVVFQLDQEHQATATKDNSTMFEGELNVITPDYGRKLYQWLEQGIDVKAQEAEKTEERRQKAISYLSVRKEQNEAHKEVIESFEKEHELEVKDMPVEMLVVITRALPKEQPA